MLLSMIKMERRAQLAIPPLPSTFAADLAAITGAALATFSFQQNCCSLMCPLVLTQWCC